MLVENTTQNQSAITTPVQLAVLETAKAVWELIGEEHTENFVVVGGGALLFHGLDVATEDVDFAITPESMHKFCVLARGDPRFVEHPLCPWRYHSSYDFDVEIDFLDKLGNYMKGLEGHCIIQGVPVAKLADLAITKGRAFLDREIEKDLDGMMYVVEKMRDTGETFKELGGDGKKALGYVMRGLQYSKEGRNVLAIVKKLL